MSKDDTMTMPESESSSGKGAGESTAKRPWDIDVDIHLKKGCPNPQFEIYTSLPTSNGEIVFKNNHRPGFNIRFNLYDETGEGYTFPPQAKVDDACWSKIGTTCPQSACKDVFKPLRVISGTTLEVFNDNPSPPLGAFKYSLRVTKDGGATYCDLDPGGADQNGPRI